MKRISVLNKIKELPKVHLLVVLLTLFFGLCIQGIQAQIASLGYSAFDETLDRTVEINSTTPNGLILSDNGLFGSSSTNMGDLNGDGVNDLAVGAPDDGRGAVLSTVNDNGNGTYTATITNTVAELVTVSATLDAGSGAVGVTDTEPVTFTAPPANDPAHFIITYDTELSGVTGTGMLTIPAVGGLYDVDINNDGTFELLDQSGLITIDVTTHGYTAGLIQVAIANAASGGGNFEHIQYKNLD